MARVTGPIKPRLNIANTLRRLRDESGQSLADVAKELMISTSKLSRLENAQGRPLPRDIRDLISHYGIDGTPLAGRMRRWVAAAQRQGWWTEYNEELLGELDVHVAYEGDATVLRAYTLPFVPALLQTEDYARAHIQNLEPRSADYARASFEDTRAALGDGPRPGSADDAADDRVSALVSVRMRRQEVLDHRDGLDPLRLVAVMHESVLRQAVGAPGILRDQLDALLDRSKAPNISLHVLPFEAHPVFTMTSINAYFEYQDTDGTEEDVVHIETHAGFRSIQDPRRVADYRNWHDALVRASLSEDASRRLIRSIQAETPGARLRMRAR